MKNDQPLVSIGMPVYSGEKYIRQALDSVLIQDYGNIEVVISDNASQDSTGEICREYIRHNRHLRYYRNEQNMGAAWNFKRVMGLTRGDFFMWLAHDDYFDSPTHISRLSSTLQTDENCILAFPNVNIVGENGKIKDSIAAFFNSCTTNDDYLIAWCKYAAGYPVYGMYCMSRMRKAGLRFDFDADLCYFNEGTFLHKLFIAGGARFVESISFNYTRSSESFVNKIPQPKMLRDFLKYTKRVLLLHLTSGLPSRQKKQLIRIISKKHGKYIANLLRSVGHQYYLTFKDRVSVLTIKCRA